MKRIAVTLALVLASSVMTAPTALAGHHGHHGYYHGHGHACYGYRGVYARPYVAAYPVVPAYAPYYPAPAYPYAPGVGLGVATPNFSFWLGQ